MKIFLTLKYKGKTYRVSSYYDVPTSGDFFKQLFINREIWDEGLTLWAVYNGCTESLGTLADIFKKPLIDLCRTASRYYGTSRLRALPSTPEAQNLCTQFEAMLAKDINEDIADGRL